MNMKLIEKNWSELKTVIKNKWDKFTDEDVESFKADLTRLTSKVETTYGIAKEQAERQFEEFKHSVKSLLEHDETNSASEMNRTQTVPVIKPKPTLAIVPKSVMAETTAVKENV